MNEELEREYGQCPDCDEKELVSFVGNRYACHKCFIEWEEI